MELALAMYTQDLKNIDTISLEEFAKKYFGNFFYRTMPYWQVFQNNIIGKVALTSDLGKLAAYATADYKGDSSIELKLECSSPFGESIASITVTRKNTSKKGILISKRPPYNGPWSRAPFAQDERKSTRRCGLDSDLRNVTNELYSQLKKEFDREKKSN